jgi:hypothetical protein
MSQAATPALDACDGLCPPKIDGRQGGIGFAQASVSGDAMIWLTYAAVCFVLGLGIRLFIRHMDARDSGWLALHRAYPATTRATGELFDRATIELNHCSYERIANLALCEEGLSVRLSNIDRLIHKPVLIPWNRMKVVVDGFNTIIQVAATPRPVALGLVDPVVRKVIQRIAARSPYWLRETRRPVAAAAVVNEISTRRHQRCA